MPWQVGQSGWVLVDVSLFPNQDKCLQVPEYLPSADRGAAISIERVGSDSSGAIFYLEVKGKAVLMRKIEIEETQF